MIDAMTFDLDPPGTFLPTGPLATRGYRVNVFALSLRDPKNREAFLADEAAYLARFGLTPVETAMVRERDWTGLLAYGGHVHAILKLAATIGQYLQEMAAHAAQTDKATLMAAFPRAVHGLPEEWR